jgi:ABC-type multidrug transport system permease subunit
MSKLHNPLVQLVLMHLREFYRVPESLFWTFLFPIGLAGLLGLAFSSDETNPKSVAVIVNTQNSTNKMIDSNNNGNEKIDKNFNQIERLQILLQTSDFKVIEVASYQEGLQAIRRGKAVIIVENKADDFNASKDSLIFHFDKKNEEAYNTHLLLQNKLLGIEVSHKPFRTSPILIQGNRYIDFVIPGLIGLGIMNSAIWGLGYSLVEFRIKKLMRRMVATPLPRWMLLYSHFLTRYLFAFIEMFFVAIFAYFVFNVQVTGSFAAFLLLFSAGLWSFSGLAILISARTNNLIVANGLINATTLPMTLASGVFFSYQGFPDWIVKIIQVLPLTLLTDGLRQIYNEGAGIAEVADKCMILGIGGTICFLVGLKIYKWY